MTSLLGLLVAGLLLCSSAPVGAAASNVPFPFPGGVSLSIRLVPTAGGVYVVVPEQTRYASRTLVAALDAGRLRPGWPIVIPGACDVVASDVDATIRATCDQRAYAFGPDGRPLRGWPVFVGGASTRVDDAVVTGGDLVALTDNGRVARLVRVTPEGIVRTGVRMPLDSDSAYWPDAMGVAQDGTGFIVSYRYSAAQANTILGTEVVAFDLARVLPGWPIRVAGTTSAPVFAPNGRVYLTQGTTGVAPTRLLVYDRAGRSVVGTTARLPIVFPTFGGTGEGPGWEVVDPLVVADGSAAIVPADTSFGTSTGIAVYRTDAAGRFRSAWTYRSGAARQDVWNAPCATPSWDEPTEPAMAADGTVYVLRADGTALAIGSSGEVKQGWPVRAGAALWAVDVGADGMVYLLGVKSASTPGAVEDCDPYAHSSGTVLTVSPDGLVRHGTTVVVP